MSIDILGLIISVDRYGIYFGSLPIRFYGVILMVGAVAAAYLATREARRRNLDPELVWDGLIWLLIGGIIGARIWHILTPPPEFVARGITTEYYLTHPLEALAVWNGGLGILGAIVGGAIALFFFTRRNKLNFLVWADIAAPAVALGQAIGRWGNYVNQELYGLPTNLPWGIYIEPGRRDGYENYTHFHPLFLYESLWNLANMGILLWMGRNYRNRLKKGDLILSYAILYSIGRFLLEFLRVGASQVGGLNINQAAYLAIMILGGALFYWRHRPGSEPAGEEEEGEDDEGDEEAPAADEETVEDSTATNEL